MVCLVGLAIPPTPPLVSRFRRPPSVAGGPGSGPIGGAQLTVERRLRRVLPYALFLLLVCVFLWRPVFTGAALLPGEYLAQMQPWSSVLKSQDQLPQWNPLAWDAIAQFYPWRVFYARSMGAGCIPLWNPHQFCGTPFLANGQSAVLYPPNLVFLLVDPITAFTLLAALHVFLAASFTYALLRELGAGELGGVIAGVVYAFSAFVVLWLELPTFPAAAAWLPLALLLIHRAVERRSLYHGMLSGLALSMPVLAGHLQIAFYVVLAAVGWWLWKLAGAVRARRGERSALRVVVPLAGCLLLLFLTSAPQALSTLELAGNSHRVRDVTAEGYARFVDHAVKPYRLVTAFQPDYYGSPARNDYFLGSAADYMEFGLYAGVLPLMLAVVGVCRLRSARWCGFFGVLAVFALLIALGTHLNAVLYYLVPGFSALGGPNRILVLYFLGISALAGFGADWLAEHARTGGRSRAVIPALIALHAVVFSGIAARVVAGRFLQGLQAGDPIHGYESPVYVALLLASGGLILAAATRRIGWRVFSVLAVSLVAADLFAFGIAFNATCDRKMVYPATPLTDKLSEAARQSRIAPVNPRWSLYQTPDAILPPNAAMVYGLYDVQGYDSLFTRQYKDLSSDIQGVDSSPPENGNMVLVRRLVGEAPWGNLRVGYILTTNDLNVADSSRLRQLDEVGGVRIYEFTDSDAGVPAYTSPNVAVASDGAGPAYPGWTEHAARKGRPLPIEGRAGQTRLFVFEPFTFRLGLFMMLVGVGVLTCAGTCRRLGSRGVQQ